MTGPMRQYAPYPDELAKLVSQLQYKTREGWSYGLADIERDPAETHKAAAGGLTLIITRQGEDSYHPERTIRVRHYFPVPAATYNRRSWQRWLFERFHDVELHELMENFIVGGQRPYAPNHGPGNDPYMVCELNTDTDRRTSFRGELSP